MRAAFGKLINCGAAHAAATREKAAPPDRPRCPRAIRMQQISREPDSGHFAGQDKGESGEEDSVERVILLAELGVRIRMAEGWR
jgi:hypothetical protein